jgi:predicted RNase H-like HicB family nuclease
MNLENVIRENGNVLIPTENKFFGFIQNYPGICTSANTIDEVHARLKKHFDHITKIGLIDKFKK